jgi:hypothetical protein
LYSLFLAAAIVVAFIKQSVTFGSDFVITPIADTTANVWFPLFALSMSKSQTPDILSEEPTHVPPNLCTFHPASVPRGNAAACCACAAPTSAEGRQRDPRFLLLTHVVAFDDFDDDDGDAFVVVFPVIVPFFLQDNAKAGKEREAEALIFYMYLLSLSLFFFFFYSVSLARSLSTF